MIVVQIEDEKEEEEDSVTRGGWLASPEDGRTPL
jgi:hypothetical protein